MAAAPDDELEDLLGALKLACVPQGARLTTDDSSRQIELYREQLKQFPADVMRRVLCDQIARAGFWPPLGDLVRAAERQTVKRRALQDCLLTVEVS